MPDKISIIENRILKEEYTSQQILGVFILLVSILNILEAATKTGIRLIINDATRVSNYQSIMSAIKLLFVVGIFVFCFLKMKKLFFHSPHVMKLLYIWGIILIPIQIMYDISAIMYNRMLGIVWLILNENYSINNDTFYAMFYDSSHGFKYLGMFIAVIIGIIATGIILERRGLITVSMVLMALFVVSFFAINMKQVDISLFAISVGINMTALIFHLLMTVGLSALGIFIFKSYIKKPIEI